MKKIIAFSLALLACAATLTGCGVKEASVDDLAAAILNEAEFAEQLNEIDDSVTLKRYGISEDMVTEVVSYAGTKAVADELAIFKAKDTDAVMEKVNEHWDVQKNSYASYRPDEVPKIDDAFVYKYGDDVIFCVSMDKNKVQKAVFDLTAK